MRKAMVCFALAITFTIEVFGTDFTFTHLGLDSAVAINASGQVAGGSGGHAALWSKGTGVTDLGTLGGTSSFALGMNDSGQVVGSSYLAGDNEFKGFLWTPGVGMQDMGLPAHSQANAINASGQVVGVFLNTSDNLDHGFLWTPGVGLRDLGNPLGGDTFAIGITTGGQVILSSVDPGGTVVHAFLWSPNTGAVDLGTLGGQSTFAYSWNDIGQVTGLSDVTGTQFAHALLWSGSGPMQDLGTLSGGVISTATQINKQGEIVGYSIGQNTDTQSFFWTQEHGMQDISSDFNSFALGINNKSLVMGSDFGGYYVWSPQTSVHRVPKVTRPVLGGINDAGQMIAEKVPRHAPKTEFLLTPLMHATIASSPNPSQSGQVVTLTTTVQALTGPPPDGEMVRFTDATKLLAKVPLTNGVAVFSTSALKVGTHSIKAIYEGDLNYSPASSKTVKQIVTP
jgi:probable HAF family extracellular repeat protein